MEQNEKVTSHVTKGLIIALTWIAVDIIALFAHFRLNQGYGIIMMIFLVVATAWSSVLFVNQNQGRVTFGNAFAHGFKATAVIAVIMFLYTLLVIYLIAPDIIDDSVQKGVDEAAKKGQTITPENNALVRKFVMMAFLAGSAIGPLILGTIGSLIGAGVAKKQPFSPLDQMSI